MPASDVVPVRAVVRNAVSQKASHLQYSRIIACTAEAVMKIVRCRQLKEEDSMNQSERRRYLIERLLEERKGYWKEDKTMQIPAGKEEQKILLRSLMNVRMPSAIDEEFLHIQDAYLQQVNAEKGIVTFSEMEELEPELYLYKGDITRLKVGAIVNAANSGMTG